MTATSPRVVAMGELILLREKTVEDASQDYQWRTDPELAAYDAARPLGITFRSFVATLAEELQHPAPHRRTFAIEDRAKGRHIGNVMYYGLDVQSKEAELGITIGLRDYWSRGYGTDTVETMTRYLFEELGLRRVYLHTLTWNYRAQECFTRAGFHRIRTVHRSGHDFVYMEAWNPALVPPDAPPPPHEVDLPE